MALVPNKIASLTIASSFLSNQLLKEQPSAYVWFRKVLVFWKINFEKTPGLVLAATEVSRPQEPQEPLLTKSTKSTQNTQTHQNTLMGKQIRKAHKYKENTNKNWAATEVSRPPQQRSLLLTKSTQTYTKSTNTPKNTNRKIWKYA